MESNRVTESYLLAYKITEVEKGDLEQVDANGKIKFQARLELDKNCSIDVKLREIKKVVDV